MNHHSVNPNIQSLQNEMSDMSIDITPPPSPPPLPHGKNSFGHNNNNSNNPSFLNATVPTAQTENHPNGNQDTNMQTTTTTTTNQHKMSMTVSPSSPLDNPLNGRIIQPFQLPNTPSRASSSNTNGGAFTAASPANNGYQFIRMNSSPSLIDASPKPSSSSSHHHPSGIGEKTPLQSPARFVGSSSNSNSNTAMMGFGGGGLGGIVSSQHKSELTPVTKNTNVGVGGTNKSSHRSKIPPASSSSSHTTDATQSKPPNPPMVPDSHSFRRRCTDSSLLSLPTNNTSSSSIPLSTEQHTRMTTTGRNAVHIRPRTTVERRHDSLLLELDGWDVGGGPPPPPPPEAVRLVSPSSIRGGPSSPPRMSHQQHHRGDDGGGGGGDIGRRYASPSSGDSLTQPIPLERNCYSVDSPNVYQRVVPTRRHTAAVGREGYAVPPSTPTSPTHPHQQHQQQPPGQLTSDDERLSPSEYMIPYQPSRDSSLASFGVDTDDADGIFLLPTRSRRRKHTQRRDDGEDCMEVCCDDGANRMGGGELAGVGGDDDGSLASSSIPSIRMAVHLASSTTTAEDQDDSILLDTNDDGSVLLEPEDDDGGGLSFVPYLNEPSSPSHYHHHHHRPLNVNVPQIQPHDPSEMAVTPSPPRITSRRFFDDAAVWDDPWEGEGERSRKQQRSAAARSHQKRSTDAMEWLRTVEVGRNNRYVAEAASSKFLMGKQQQHQQQIQQIQQIHPVAVRNSLGGGGGGGLMLKANTKGYHAGERSLHGSTVLTAPGEPAGVGTGIRPANAHPKGRKSNETGATCNTGRREVMGRSINMFQGPTIQGQSRGVRGKKVLSRPRASAIMR